MGFQIFRRKRRLTTQQRMILEHTRWLNQALRRPHAFPRIPVRRVSEGGFARLMASRTGRRVAFGWWEAALKQIS